MDTVTAMNCDMVQADAAPTTTKMAVILCIWGGSYYFIVIVCIKCLSEFN